MIVVTGGTGTVGSRLVDLLSEKDERVRVFCRDVDKARDGFGDRVEVAAGDLGDAASVRSAFAGADRVFLLTASSAEPGTLLDHARTVIATAKDAGVRHVVKLSVLGADQHSPIRYARFHHQAEEDLEASGLAYTILRPSAFMQNFFRFVSDGSIYTCAEDGKVAMVDAGDIAAVAAAALTREGHENKTYTLTGPEALSYDDAAEILSQATGRAIEHVRVPPASLIEAMTGAGVPHWLAEDLATQFGVFAASSEAPTSDIAAVTGREPRSLDDFAREEFAGASHPT